jgi:eukaryotic-like serine/threonine-protein kinase
MGTVYRAHHQMLRRDVALKLMSPEFTSNKTYVGRFKREASASSRLDHINSTRVIDSGEDETGTLYIAMELIEGKTLQWVIDHQFPLATERIVNILVQVLAGVASAHDASVIHRDLKPANIMLVASKDDDGHPIELVKVCDFGVAAVFDEDSDLASSGSLQTTTTTLTTKGTTVGTPEYMSPEQAIGERIDARTDIYALGVILFQMLTRKLPFEAPTALKVMLKHVQEAPPIPSQIASRVNPKLEAICLRALGKRPTDRYQTSRDMRAELRAVLEAPTQLRMGTPGQAMPTLPLSRKSMMPSSLVDAMTTSSTTTKGPSSHPSSQIVVPIVVGIAVFTLIVSLFLLTR